MNKIVNFGKKKKKIFELKCHANSMALEHAGIITPHINQLGTLIHQNPTKL
jgi:hypothetical protein